MPSQDDVFKEICNLVEAGAAEMGVPLGSDIESMLRDRYFKWIVVVKPEVGKSAMDVWDEEAGKKIQGAFSAIGRAAAQSCKDSGGTAVDAAEGTTAAQEIEGQSDCPFCPPPFEG